MATLPVYRALIEPAWIDYNGHLRDAYYALLASYATDDVLVLIGLDEAYREATRCTFYSLEMHVHYLHEVMQSDDLYVVSTVLDSDHKRIHLRCTFHCSRLPQPMASVEMMLLHVQQGEPAKSAPLPDSVIAVLDDIKRSQSSGAPAAAVPESGKIGLKRR